MSVTATSGVCATVIRQRRRYELGHGRQGSARSSRERIVLGPPSTRSFGNVNKFTDAGLVELPTLDNYGADDTAVGVPDNSALTSTYGYGCCIK